MSPAYPHRPPDHPHRGTRRSLALMLTAVLWLFASPTFAQFGLPTPGSPGEEDAFYDSRDATTVTIKAGKTTVPRGGDLPVVIIMDHDAGWHSWPNANRTDAGEFDIFDSAIYTELTVITDPNADAVTSQGVLVHDGFADWPGLHASVSDFGEGTKTFGTFDGRAIIHLPVTIAADAPLGAAKLVISLDFQSCDATTCKSPATQMLVLEFEIVEVGQPSISTPDADFDGFPADVWSRIHSGEKAADIVPFDVFGFGFTLDVNGPGGFALLLLIAAVGGFLLNLTPCVLPVIPIKIMGLSHAAKGSRSRTFMLGLAMFLGVVAFWMALALPIAFVRSFTATNQLFQMPWFSIGVGVFIIVMAIAMCGLFMIQLPQSVYMINPNHESLHGSFLFGIMAGVLSTPCTAPVMGAAVAWAATQPTITILIVFAAVAMGMGIPYLILSAFPNLVEKMPRTGPASELIKQVMGLLMLAAGVYFLGVGLSGMMTSPPDPPSRLYLWAVALLGTAAGVWLVFKTITITKRAPNRIVFGGIGLLVVAISTYYIGFRMTAKGPINWTYYTAERFDDARSRGDVVVMEFTAEWCLNCKALEVAVLYTDRVAQALNGPGVTPIKVDLTGNNTEGNAMLAASARATIPLLIVYAPDGTEIFKSDFYTIDQVVDAVKAAQGDVKVAGK